MIYFVMFILSVFLLGLGDRCKKRHKILGHSLIAFGLALPVLMAGFRDASVGVDVEFYVVPFFKRARNYSGLLEYASQNHIDIIYALMNYIIAKFTTNIVCLLLVIHTIDIVFTYAAFCNFRFVNPPWVLMLYYYLLCYNNSLSTVRQSMGTALVIYGVSLIFKNNHQEKGYLYALAFVVVATGIQTGSIIGVLPIFIIYAIYKGMDLRKVIGSIICVFLVFGIFKKQIIYFMYLIVGTINSKYLRQTPIIGRGVSDNLTATFLCVMVTVLSIMLCKRDAVADKKITMLEALQIILCKKNITENKNLKMLELLTATVSLVMLVCYLLLSDYRVIVRMLLTLQIFWPLSLSLFSELFKQNAINKLISGMVMSGVITFFWWYMYIFVDMVQTANYLLAV